MRQFCINEFIQGICFSVIVQKNFVTTNLVWFPVIQFSYQVNITERKIQENLLRESEANLRNSQAELEQRVLDRTAALALAGERLREVSARVTAIVGTMADGVLIIDELGIVETMNPAAERMFGYDASEVIGRNIKMLMPEPYQSAHDGYLERYRSTGVATIKPFCAAFKPKSVAICTPKAASNVRATAPAATRAAVSRALARSRMSRMSSRWYFKPPDRSA